MAMFSQAWMFFALIAGVGLLGYNICAKLGGGNLPPVIFATIMYVSGFLAVLPLFFWFMKDKPQGYLGALPIIPVIFAIGAGVVVIFIDTSVSYMFNKGAPVGIGMTSVNVVALSLTTLVGFLFFKENYSFINVLGVILAIASIPLMFHNAK